MQGQKITQVYMVDAYKQGHIVDHPHAQFVTATSYALYTIFYSLYTTYYTIYSLDTMHYKFILYPLFPSFFILGY